MLFLFISYFHAIYYRPLLSLAGHVFQKVGTQTCDTLQFSFKDVFSICETARQ